LDDIDGIIKGKKVSANRELVCSSVEQGDIEFL
jgi:hypothetical protein